MNSERKDIPKKGKGGRNPKDDKVIFRYSVNLNEVENVQFLSLFEQSGLHSKARFIAARIFNDEFRVIKTEREAVEYTTKLTTLYAQFRSIGVNYNQVTKTLKTNFTEKKALAMLYKLEQATLELIETNRQIIELSQKFQEEWLQE